MQAANDEIDRGLVVEGKYRLEDKLGAGGMGTVWVAEDLQLGRRIALKFPADELQRDASFLERFALEARHASMVRSPHVVQIFGQGFTDAGVPFIAMELLEGCDLAEHLAHRGSCGLAETSEILEQVCHALQRAHQAGLIHRDIKPQNIFVTPERDGRAFVRVLDFGIAKNVDRKVLSLTRSHVGMGSLLYMSPEQIRDSKSVTPRTDIWALGVVTYELLTGRVPFDSDSAPEFMHRVSSGLFTPASQLQSRLPSAVDAFISRALQPDPALRFATVEEMSLAFTRIARSHAPGAAMRDSSPSSSRSHTDLAPSARARTTARALAPSRNGALALGLGLAVSLLAGIGFWPREQTSELSSSKQSDNSLGQVAPASAAPEQTAAVLQPDLALRERELAERERKAEEALETATRLAEKLEADRRSALEKQAELDARQARKAAEASAKAAQARAEAEAKAKLEGDAHKRDRQLSAPSEALRATIVAAIERANKLEARAQRTLSTAGLNSSHSGKALQAIVGAIKALSAQNEFVASVPASAKVESVLVSGDQLTAQVRTTEVWETSWYDRSTNLCKRHVHQRPLPQTVYLRFNNGQWLIDDVRHYSTTQPAIVACHG
jgi:serine/threonine protein kinase